MSAEPFAATHVPLSPDEEDRIGSLLRLHLARDEVSSRAGAGSSRYQYLATNKVVELANFIFGYGGWSSAIQDITIDFMEETKDNRWNIGVSCIMRISVRAGSFHEDVGYGQTVNMPGRAEALEKAKKEACSDGLKRAMRLFGNKLGNCLGDQQYMQLLKSGKGQKEPLDLTTSPRKRMKLEPALTASTHNNNTAPHPPHSPLADGHPLSPQQPYQPPPATSPNMPASPNATAPPPQSSASPAVLTAYNRQPVPSPPAAPALSAASFPYKPRQAASAPPPRPGVVGKENWPPIVGREGAFAAGGAPMDTSASNAPLPSIQGIKNSLPASAHAAATPYPSTAFTPAVKQEVVPNATAPYGPPTTTAPRTFHTNQPATRPYAPHPAPNTHTDSTALSPPTASHHAAYGYATGGVGAATFPAADCGGGGFFGGDGNSSGSGTAPAAVVGGSFFGSDDDDGTGFISQFLTHNNAAAGQGGTTAVVNNA